MFLINIIELFVSLECVRYVFCAFGFYGIMLALKRLTVGKKGVDLNC